MQNLPAKVLKLAEIIKENGGRALLVGGCVRDFLMSIEPKILRNDLWAVKLFLILLKFNLYEKEMPKMWN